MRKAAILMVFTVLLFCAAGESQAAVVISSSSPVKFFQGNYPDDSLPLEIQFASGHILPADVTGHNVDRRVKIFARNEGEFEPIHASGWSRSGFQVWIPTRMLAQRGFLQVKVRFDGNDTGLFNIPVLPAPSESPVITQIDPAVLPPGDGTRSETIRIYGNHIDNYGFTRVKMSGRGIFVGNVVLDEGDSGLVMAQIPKEMMASAGNYEVELVTRAGKSKPVDVCIGCVKYFPVPIQPARKASMNTQGPLTAQATAPAGIFSSSNFAPIKSSQQTATTTRYVSSDD